MSRFWDRSLGSKLFAISIVCFLLCIPLCGYGVTLDDYRGTRAQQICADLGFFLLFASGVIFVVALLVMIFAPKKR